MSPMFKGRRAYVERSCDEWLILSAKHGLVHPDEELDPYDETLVGQPTSVKAAWAKQVLIEVKRVLGERLDGIVFEMHAGADYRAFGLEDGLRRAGSEIENPTDGLGQGQQLAFYGSGSTSEPQRRGGGGGRGGSYAELGAHLEESSGKVRLSFIEVERILSRQLPASARKYRAWWANDTSHTQARAWMAGGWEVTEVTLTEERVTFDRAR